MQQTLDHVAAALKKRGFHPQSGPSTWAHFNVTVSFRPQDDSFRGHWTDGSLNEYVFFDFPPTDPEQCHLQFVRLLQWVEDRVKRTIVRWLADEDDCPLAA